MSIVKQQLAALAKVAGATDNLLKGIEDLRRKIIVAKEERIRIEELPVSADAALARLNDWLAQKEEGALRLMASFTGRRLPGDRALPAITITDGLLELAVASAVAPVIKHQLEEFYRDHESISDADRQAQLDEMELEISQLEDIEERMIRICEQSGTMVLRRIDADPRSVLAFDADLPLPT